MAIDPITAGLIGGNILGGLFGSSATRRAARDQANAIREGIASQERMFERGLEAQAPFREAGIEAQNMLMERMRNFRPYQASAGLSPAELASEQFNFQADPGYAFRMSEGLKALERTAAARGGLLSGGAGKAFQRYGQDLASQEYGSAFDRFQRDRAARANLGAMEYGQFTGERSGEMLPLLQTAATGRGVTSDIANQMMNLGGAQAQAAGAVGSAAAAGRLGQAQTFSNTLGQLGNLYMGDRMYNMLQSRQQQGYPTSYYQNMQNYGPAGGYSWAEPS
jgi:hypothetical protein